MTRGTVCLTFDVDALSGWVARGVTTATPRSRGEFAAVAVPRLVELLRRRDIVATWFVPAHTATTYPDLTRSLAADGHEVALHGWAHENVAALERDTERDLLARSIAVLEDVTGVRPVGFRAPSWDLSDHSVALMAEQGLRYDSSLMGHDHAPYWCRTGDAVDTERTVWGQEIDLAELPVSWSLDDYPFLEFLAHRGSVIPGLGDPREMFGRWYDDLRWMLRELDDGVLTATCHPEVIGRGHRLLALEEWLDRVLEQDVTTSTCAHVAQRFAGGARLGRPDPTS